MRTLKNIIALSVTLALTCALIAPSSQAQATKAAAQATQSAGQGLEPEPDITTIASELTNDGLTKKHPELAPAWELLKKGDEKGATDILKAAVSKAPELPPAELMIGHFYVSQNNGQKAIHQLDQAVKTNPQDPGAYLTLAGLAIAQGRYTEASLLLERVERLVAALPENNPRKKPLTLVANNHWATVMGRFERWPECRDRLQQVLKIEPDNPMAHFRLANTLFSLHKGQDGFAEFQKAYKLSKKLPTPPVAVAMYYQRSNQVELADKWMNYAEKQYGKDAPTQVFLGTSRWQQGRADDARRHTKAAAAADPTAANIQFLEGVISHYDGDLKTAEDKLEAAFKAAPADLQVRDHLAKVLIQSSDQPKRQRALGLAQQTVQAAQNNRDAIATLAWILYNSGQTDQAVQAFGVVTQGPINGDTAYFVARVLVDRKQNEDAKKLLTDALNQKGLFVHRPDAEKLLAQLKA